MSQVTISTSNSRRVRETTIHVDMTPLVDLAFLLVTFFILTTSMLEPRVMEVIYPDDSGEPMKINNAITLLLAEGDSPVYYYTGEFMGEETRLVQTGFAPGELRKILLNLNQDAIDGSHSTLTAVVKTLPQTPY